LNSISNPIRVATAVKCLSSADSFIEKVQGSGLIILSVKVEAKIHNKVGTWL